MSQTEQTIQRAITKYLSGRGCYVVKVIVANKKGIPDILACYKGRFIALEVKKPGKQPTELQAFNLKAVAEAGGLSAKVDSLEAVKRLLKELE